MTTNAPPRIQVPFDKDNVAVRLLRSVRASNGQEFMSGWTCGFTKETADDLIARGWAVALESSEPPKPMQPEPSGIPGGFAPTTKAPEVSTGADSEPAEEAPAAQESQPPSPRRKRV